MQLQAYQIGDRADVEFLVEGTSRLLSMLPEKDEAREIEAEIRTSLTKLCAGDRELALDVRDYFLYLFFDERDLWPINDEFK